MNIEDLRISDTYHLVINDNWASLILENGQRKEEVKEISELNHMEKLDQVVLSVQAHTPRTITEAMDVAHFTELTVPIQVQPHSKSFVKEI